VHKARNVRDHLPESRRGYVAKQMRDAYDSTTAATAKKKLMQLASWLESNGEDSAAESEAMIRRWIALGIAEAQKGFRRVKGYRNMPSLIAALRKTNVAVATEKKVA
jgi:hypothetical protein